MKYIVANTYRSKGCEGPVRRIASVSTDKCYYAPDECASNRNLQPQYDFLKTLVIGTDVSLTGVCKGGSMIGSAYSGKSCNGNIIGDEVSVPSGTCVSNVIILNFNRSSKFIAATTRNLMQLPRLKIITLLKNPMDQRIDHSLSWSQSLF